MGYSVSLRDGYIKQNKTMYSIEGYELGIACIVFTGYIVGKLWMYYKTNEDETNDK
jgi:hypothetical protein